MTTIEASSPKGPSEKQMGPTVARLFRYEVRRWRNGVIPDVACAIASPVPAARTDPRPVAQRVLELLSQLSIPAPVWGRTNCTRARCGTPTPSPPGCSPRAATRPPASSRHPSGRAPGLVRRARRRPDAPGTATSPPDRFAVRERSTDPSASAPLDRQSGNYGLAAGAPTRVLAPEPQGFVPGRASAAGWGATRLETDKVMWETSSSDRRSTGPPTQ